MIGSLISHLTTTRCEAGAQMYPGVRTPEQPRMLGEVMGESEMTELVSGGGDKLHVTAGRLLGQRAEDGEETGDTAPTL